MFATFLVETERRLGVLRDLSGDDRDAIGFEAHTLIGSSGTFGMMRLSRLSRELERRSATIAPDAYRAAVERLLEVYRVSRHELLDYLRPGRADAGRDGKLIFGPGSVASCGDDRPGPAMPYSLAEIRRRCLPPCSPTASMRSA